MNTKPAYGYLIPALLFAAVLAFDYLISPKIYPSVDTERYLQIIQGEPTINPYAYRVFVPYLIKWMPFRIDQAFFMITYISSFLTLFTFFLLLNTLGVSRSSSLLTTLFLGTSYSISFYAGSYGLIDPFSNFLFVLLILAMLKKRWGFAVFIFLIGAFAKETIFILLPLFFIHIAKKTDNENSFLKALILSSIPFIAFIVLRWCIPVIEGPFDVKSIADVKTLFNHIISYNVSDVGIIARLAREFLRSYGYFWIMAVAGLKLNRNFRVFSYYLICAGIALCFGATDWSRMLATVFPGVFIPCAFFMDKLDISNNRLMMKSLLALSVFQGYLSLVGIRDLTAFMKAVLILSMILVFLAGGVLVVIALGRIQRASQK